MSRALKGLVLPAQLGAVEGAGGVFVSCGEEERNGHAHKVAVVTTAAAAAALGKQPKGVALCENVPVADLDQGLLSQAALVPIVAEVEEAEAAVARGAVAVCVSVGPAGSGEAVRLVRALRRAQQSLRDQVYVLLPRQQPSPADVCTFLRMGAAATIVPTADNAAAFVTAAKEATVPLPTYNPTTLRPTTNDPFVSPRPPGNARQSHSDWEKKAADKMMGGNSQRAGGLFEGGFSGGR
eukprot:Hpha_TRINITY_DN14673_c1_g2::TRINITY_DN14673_c1_g2_i1::g.48480::m.48480